MQRVALPMAFRRRRHYPAYVDLAELIRQTDATQALSPGFRQAIQRVASPDLLRLEIDSEAVMTTV